MTCEPGSHLVATSCPWAAANPGALCRNFRSGRAAMIHDLRALRLEGRHPLVDTRDRQVVFRLALHVSGATTDASRLEQIAELGIAQLVQEVRQKGATGLADRGIREGVLDRGLQLSDTFRAVLPDRFFLPVLEA